MSVRWVNMVVFDGSVNLWSRKLTWLINMRLCLYRRGCSVSALLWNSLPSYLKCFQDYDAFKSSKWKEIRAWRYIVSTPISRFCRVRYVHRRNCDIGDYKKKAWNQVITPKLSNVQKWQTPFSLPYHKIWTEASIPSLWRYKLVTLWYIW